jgi:glycyl-tRNA synthetase
MKTFQEFTMGLVSYWQDMDCVWSQPYDFPMGAGTFHPHTFLKGVGPEPWRTVYVQPCRRPVDGRYGKSTYRFQHYYQLQVLLKPAPSNIIDLFLNSLNFAGISFLDNDICLLEDDWKGPTLGAWGLGWEIRANGQEVTQFTYFQQLGGLDTEVVAGEITYGLERLYMYTYGIKNGLDIPYNRKFTYGDLYFQNEFEFSRFNFEKADVQELKMNFSKCEENVSRLVSEDLVLPAYDYVLQASHLFNLLDSRGSISASERQRYIGRVRECARKCALAYRQARERMDFPICKREESDGRLPLLPVANLSGAFPHILKSEPMNQEELKSTLTSKDKKEISNILVELGVEEMPPQFQVLTHEFLQQSCQAFLLKQKNKFAGTENNEVEIFLQQLEKISTSFFVSPRRISVLLKNAPFVEPNLNLELLGPAVAIAFDVNKNLTKAGEGFCRKNGVSSADIFIKEKSEGSFICAVKKLQGERFSELFIKEFAQWIVSVPTQVTMRWLPDLISKPFIRPVRWLLALEDDLLIPMNLFGLQSNHTTYGHRFTSSEPFKVTHALRYPEKMASLGIVLSIAERMKIISEHCEKICSKMNASIKADNVLMQKLAGLSESPDVFLGEFDKKYLRLPEPLVSGVLKDHMNYFSVLDKNGALLPFYIGVANYVCKNREEMILGTRVVVEGRLDDGAFYYDSDLNTPIESFFEKLREQVFQESMGTVFDKTNRILEYIKLFGYCSSNDICAARLCKIDLRTGTVQEFPEDMQGVMSGELILKNNSCKDYALSNGVKLENLQQISNSMSEHYLPINSESLMPKTILGRALSLADKLDSLSMYLNSGMKVQGNKDPHGLRRLALAILRLMGLEVTRIEGENYFTFLNLTLFVEQVFKLKQILVHANLKAELKSLFLSRLKASLKERNWLNEICIWVECMFFAEHNKLPLCDLVYLAKEYNTLLEEPDSQQNDLKKILEMLRRAKNLISGENEFNETMYSNFLDNGAKFNELTPEHLFQQELLDMHKKYIALPKKADGYKLQLRILAGLDIPMAKFLDSVMIHDSNPEIRGKRVELLKCAVFVLGHYTGFGSFIR